MQLSLVVQVGRTQESDSLLDDYLLKDHSKESASSSSKSHEVGVS